MLELTIAACCAKRYTANRAFNTGTEVYIIWATIKFRRVILPIYVNAILVYCID